MCIAIFTGSWAVLPVFRLKISGMSQQSLLTESISRSAQKTLTWENYKVDGQTSSVLEAFAAVVTFGIQQSESSTGIQQGWYNINYTTTTAIWNRILLDRNVQPLTPGREMNMLSCAIHIFITTLLADGAVSLYTPLTGWSPKWNNWRPTGRAKSERSTTLIWIIKQFSNFLSFWLLSRGWGLDEQGCS